MLQAQPLGRLLVASGLLTQQALDEVLALQKTDGRRLGEILADRGLVRPHQLAQFLSHQLSCPWVSLQRVEVAREAVDLLPREIAVKHHMVPVHLRASKGKAALYVAMDDPTDDVALSEASAATVMPVKPMVALSSEIQTLLERLYGTGAGLPSVPPKERSPSLVAIAEVSIKLGHLAISEAIARGTATSSTRPPKPPPPKASVPPPTTAAAAPPELSLILDEVEVIDDGPGSRPSAAAKVIVVDPKEGFLVSVRGSALKFGGDAIGVPLAEVPKAITEHSPCAIVITEATYANERSGLDRMALEAAAVLIVSNDQFEGRQFEGLLEGAIKRWRIASYEKGTILEGRYELLRDLGGRVAGSRWEVRHLRTARRSMLKVGVRAAHDETDADAVRREQMALAHVHHPGAVDLRDAGNTELGDPYIVVEMVEGRTLEGLVAARGALEPDPACSIIRQVAHVLVTAHDAGVRHGSVRPENILIVRDPWGVERVKLIHWEAATIATTEGKQPVADMAIDLTGLGSCAFLALAGRNRNAGEDALQTSSGSGWQKALSPQLAGVIARSIGIGSSSEATTPFTSARELLEALEAATPPHAREAIALLEANPEHRVSAHPPKSTTGGAASAKGSAPATSATSATSASIAEKVEDLRRFQRAAYRTPIRIEVPGIGAVDGRSEDISEGGLFVVTRGKIADGAQVTVRFALPIDGKVVSEQGIVKWSRAPKSGDGGEPRAIGIELSAPGAESVKQIARYVSFMASDK